MAGDDERLISGDNQERADNALRPTTLAEFIGQGNGRANLETFIHAARQRGDAMDHSLLHGPPGLGKTTLAQIIATEWCHLRQTAARCTALHIDLFDRYNAAPHTLHTRALAHACRGTLAPLHQLTSSGCLCKRM